MAARQPPPERRQHRRRPALKTAVPYRRWRLAVLVLVAVLFAVAVTLTAVLLGPALATWLRDLLP